VSLLKTLKKLLCPLPVKFCCTKGCSVAPNFSVPKIAVPKIAGCGISLKTMSAGCGVSKLS